MTISGVAIENLAQFRRDLRAAEASGTRDLVAALRAAGVPVVERASELAPVGPTEQGGVSGRQFPAGSLRSGYSVSVRATAASLVNKVPYSAGAEWGLYGKWSGFRKYPAVGVGASAGRGRFAWRAVFERQEEIAAIIFEGLRELVTIRGWAAEV